MPLKPVTFKIEEAEIKALEKEAKSLDPPKMRSEYVRDIVMNRTKPSKAPRTPKASEI